MKDERGKPLKDAEGNTVYRTVQLEKPKVFSVVVYNAEQIAGLPPLQHKTPDWDRHERAEAVLKASGVEIRYDQTDRAFYRPATDRINLPPRDKFSSADCFYGTALHEAAQGSGHSSRLDRDLAHPFGSEGYAKEELRAEIASLMIGDRLGIGHDPGQHAAYVDSWIKVPRTTRKRSSAPCETPTRSPTTCSPMRRRGCLRIWKSCPRSSAWPHRKRSSANRRRSESGSRADENDDSMQMEPMNEPIDPGRAG